MNTVPAALERGDLIATSTWTDWPTSHVSDHRGGRRHRQRQPPVVELLLDGGRPVRAMVHRDDDRADALRELGADVVVGDLTNPQDVANAMAGVDRMFFNMSVSPDYLTATSIVCAVALEAAPVEVIVNMSQMTVSQMTLTSTSESQQHRLHWLAEHIMNWSGVPVVHVRPTVFMENPLFTMLAARSVRERGVLVLPFGSGRTSPIAAADVARVVAALLREPAGRIGAVYELTGPEVLDIDGIAEQYARALGRPVTAQDMALDEWTRAGPRPIGTSRRTSSSTSRRWRDCTARAATTAAPTTSRRSPARRLKRSSSTWPRTPTCLADRVDRTAFDRLFDMTDRTVIVTGGTRGIGLALAEGFVLAGARVVVASRKPDACEQAAAHLRGLGGQAIGVPTHLGDVEDLGALVQRTVDEFGGIDVVVNNAANPLAQPLGEHDGRGVDQVVRGEPARPGVPGAGGAAASEGQRARRGAEHGVGRRVHLLADAVHLLVGEGGDDVVHPVDGRRVRAARHPGQRASHPGPVDTT